MYNVSEGTRQHWTSDLKSKFEITPNLFSISSTFHIATSDTLVSYLGAYMPVSHIYCCWTCSPSFTQLTTTLNLTCIHNTRTSTTSFKRNYQKAHGYLSCPSWYELTFHSSTVCVITRRERPRFRAATQCQGLNVTCDYSHTQFPKYTHHVTVHLDISLSLSRLLKCKWGRKGNLNHSRVVLLLHQSRPTVQWINWA